MTTSLLTYATNGIPDFVKCCIKSSVQLDFRPNNMLLFYCPSSKNVFSRGINVCNCMHISSKAYKRKRSILYIWWRPFDILKNHGMEVANRKAERDAA